MADCRTIGFRAQLTTAMDSVLRTAVIEITKIFENSLHDHQVELAQKGEEIAQLKIKLQRAELKLKESHNGGDGRAEMDQIQIVETQREPENASKQTSHVAEIDFEVPDDWCAPLGCENLTKQYDGVCPSVRLRQLSIPLWNIPVIKQEVVNRDIDSHQPTKAGRKSRRGSSLKASCTQDNILPILRTRRPPVRNDMKHLLQEIKEEYSGSTVTTGHRKRGQNLTGKEQENVTKRKSKRRKNVATESVSKQKETMENGGKVYSCKFCHKVFDTEFGRSVHVRSHKRCGGCKKEFPFPSALRYHKPSCQKLKKLLTIESESCDKEKLSTPSKKQEIVKKDSTFSSDSCSASARRHKNQMKSRETNRDLGWTKPLEEPEDNGEGLISLSKDASGAANYNNVQRERSPDTTPSPGWQTMGTRGSNGYSCLMCLKLVKSRSMLIEHFRIHTGEKPIKCEKCPKKFRCRAQLCKHRKRCRFPLKKFPCQQCGKNFPSPRELDRHVFDFHRDWPNICQDCGKGFLTEGPLKNHIHRFHK